MSLFHSLSPTKESVQVPGRFEWLVTRYVFTVRRCWHLAQTPSWRTTPCRLFATAYTIYSQLPSILEAIPPTEIWKRAMPWWQGPSIMEELSTWRTNYKSLTVFFPWSPLMSSNTYVCIIIFGWKMPTFNGIRVYEKKSCKEMMQDVQNGLQWSKISFRA